MSDLNTASGVNYNALDAFKRFAQRMAARTDSNTARLGVYPFKPSRGESAFLVSMRDQYLAHVEEGLGTKNLVADAMNNLVPLNEYYDRVGWDTVAMIVNDIITVGALPVSLAMHLAVGDSKWFENTARYERLVGGWSGACDYARCIMGPGETPELRGIVNPETVVISGSALGLTQGQRWFNPQDIIPGDVIVHCESSGVHANGITKMRDIAAKLPEGYLTAVPGGRTFGEEILNKTHIYVAVVEECLREGIEVHYAVNITGHGWRKHLRATKELGYIIHTLPQERPIFSFIQKYSALVGSPMSLRDMYGSYNMGVGFALYVSRRHLERFMRMVGRHDWPFRIYEAGMVVEGKKSLNIKPLNIAFGEKDLDLR
jgi:phosphoribosylformylglycinamidine cyclo-ligase